jgi:hypothetical protein
MADRNRKRIAQPARAERTDPDNTTSGMRVTSEVLGGARTARISASDRGAASPAALANTSLVPPGTACGYDC